jgi:hypothetical protein
VSGAGVFCLPRRFADACRSFASPHVCSAAYVFAALVLSFGTGMSKSTSTCNASSLLCLCFYSSSKFWLYLFLLEKLRVVQAVKKPRLRSKQYLALLTMISVPCTAFIVLMVFGASPSTGLTCIRSAF